MDDLALACPPKFPGAREDFLVWQSWKGSSQGSHITLSFHKWEQDAGNFQSLAWGCTAGLRLKQKVDLSVSIARVAENANLVFKLKSIDIKANAV